MLTLVLVPASFSLALGLEKRMGKYMRRLITYKGPEDHGPAPAHQPAE